MVLRLTGILGVKLHILTAFPGSSICFGYKCLFKHFE
jgi:hypothetical protein